MVVRSIMRVEGGDIYAVLGWRVGGWMGLRLQWVGQDEAAGWESHCWIAEHRGIDSQNTGGW